MSYLPDTILDEYCRRAEIKNDLVRSQLGIDAVVFVEQMRRLGWTWEAFNKVSALTSFDWWKLAEVCRELGIMRP